jgi:ABC-type phosphate transport system auxiliary subunit
MTRHDKNRAYAEASGTVFVPPMSRADMVRTWWRNLSPTWSALIKLGITIAVIAVLEYVALRALNYFWPL